jgi:sterol desaturase/sphingolipid hydroxylase (fatty acid hydroxylase superfamily)
MNNTAERRWFTAIMFVLLIEAVVCLVLLAGTVRQCAIENCLAPYVGWGER